MRRPFLTSRFVLLASGIILLVPCPRAHAGPASPTWQMFGPPGNVFDVSAIDPVTRRQYLVTPAETTDSLLCMWSAPLDSAAEWQVVETLGLTPTPSPNELHGVRYSVVDPVHRRWLVGMLGDDRTRIFSFETQRWTSHRPDLGPDLGPNLTIDGFEMVVDTARNRLYRFGGRINSKEFPVIADPPLPFTLDSLAAAALSPPWDPSAGGPYGLREPAMAIDSRRQQIWVHGGQRFVYMSPINPILTVDDLWMFDLSTSRWSLIEQPGLTPGARYRHHFAVDTLQDRLILWGGVSASGVALEDWWSLPLGTTGSAAWSRIVPANAQPRPLDAAAFDPVRRVFSFGGGSGSERGGRFEFAIDGTPRWSTIVPDRADPPNGSRLFFDTSRDRAMLVTARTFYDSPVQPRPDWVVRLGSGRAPDSCVFVADPARHRILAMGGLAGTTPLDTLLAMDVEGGAWTALSPAGIRPPARFDASAVLDREQDRVVYFGGHRIDTNGQHVWLEDLWALSLSGPPAWTRLDTLESARPQPRQGAAMVLDSVAHRLVIWGGRASAVIRSDVMAFSLESGLWSALAPTGTAPPWQDRFSVWDPTRRRLWVISAPLIYSHLFTLTLAGEPAWSQPELQGNGPFLRGPGFVQPSRVVGDYDAVHDRIVIQRYAPGQGTLWVLSMFDPRLPERPLLLEASVQGPAARIRWWVGRGVTSALAVERRVEGGDWIIIDSPTVNDQGEVMHLSSVPALGTRYHFRLRSGDGTTAIYSTEVELEFPRAFVARASISSPDPQTGQLRFAFTLPTGTANAELGLYDVLGRLKWRRTFEGDGRRYDVLVDETTLPPGLYFARLSTSGRTLVTKRTTLLR